MKVDFVDLKKQNSYIKKDFLKIAEQIIDNASFVAGGYSEQFEKNFAEKVGTKHCIAVNAGTAALIASLAGLKVGKGHEVIVPANTFVATAEAIVAVGATPVFVDCEFGAFNIDPNAIEKAITSNTKAIIGVHLYGNPFRFDEINEICKKYGLFCIEDTAQAHFADYKGKNCGALGDVSAFSFFPSKNLGGLGHGGAVCLNDDNIARDIRRYVNHGVDVTGKYLHHLIGVNYKLSSILAAGLNLKLNYIDEWIEGRRRAARIYKENLKVETLKIYENTNPVWHLFPVHVKNRDQIVNHLASHQIATGMHYPLPIHLQEGFSYLGHNIGDFPNAEYNAFHVISLPMHESLTEEQVLFVCEKFNEAVEKYNG